MWRRPKFWGLWATFMLLYGLGTLAGYTLRDSPKPPAPIYRVLPQCQSAAAAAQKEMQDLEADVRVLRRQTRYAPGSRKWQEAGARAHRPYLSDPDLTACQR